MSGAILVLEDGRTFPGRAVGAPGTTFGEVVFNTGMSGYQETLTDLSYRGQIVVMTAAHIGNYGLNDEDVESSRIRSRAFARAISGRFLERARQGADRRGASSGRRRGNGRAGRTRPRAASRSRGVMRGAISTETASGADEAALVEKVKEQPTMAGAALALTVGTTARYGFALPPGVARKGRVAAIDYGIKRNILRMLAARGLEPTVFPAAAPAEELLAGGFDGYFLSNGPGDPDALPSCVAEVKRLVESGAPVFGICLGQQLLGLALGGTTYKLKFGHRGANHPVRNIQTGRVAITSQNHGFSVAADSLPPNVELTHVNLNDGTCEGFRTTDRPVFAVQYHPESAPGPHDSGALFDEFVNLVERGG